MNLNGYLEKVEIQDDVPVPEVKVPKPKWKSKYHKIHEMDVGQSIFLPRKFRHALWCSVQYHGKKTDKKFEFHPMSKSMFGIWRVA